ncbi:hypothetical protein BSKO_12564 [Bryopsis sp. KO-2023]|nr:hypothetical protein BSKO_12564 [Bryopsis sp. KO-2023]
MQDFWPVISVVCLVAALPVRRWGVLAGDGGRGLSSYFNGHEYSSRGEWFNVLDWAQASTICDTRPDSVACMACSFDLPKFAVQERLAPLGVFDELWFNPEPAAVCGMCLKVWLPNGTDAPACHTQDYETQPDCPGRGDSPWSEKASEPWAWSSPVYWDEKDPYIYAIIVEWYDVDVPHKYGIAYATQGRSPQGMGNWPVRYKAVPCPVSSFTLEYSLVRYEGETNLYSRKLMIAGQRTPITAVEIFLEDGKWHKAERTADGFWSHNGGIKHSRDSPFDLKIWCTGNPQPAIEKGLVPSEMMCIYQDPDCKRTIGKVQC